MYTTRQLSNLTPRCLANLADSYRGGTNRRIAHNTWVRRDPNGDVVVRFHATDILRFDMAAGTVVMNTGGYHTNTTKQRLNALLPARLRIVQKDYRWSVVDNHDGAAYPFEDGVAWEWTRPAFEVVAEYTVAV